MKKMIILVAIACIATFSVKAQATGEEIKQLLDQGKRCGLAGYLTTVRELCETKMVALKDDSALMCNKFKVHYSYSRYNLVKLSVDVLLNQLATDMVNSNCLKTYRKVNTYLRDSKKTLPNYLAVYGNLCSDIETNTLQLCAIENDTKAGVPALADITGAATLIYGIIKDASEARKGKVSDMLDILRSTRLPGIGEINKPI